MRTLFFSLAVVSLFPVSGMAQAPSIAWSKAYGGDRSQDAQSVRPTPDGGFILGGYTMSTPSGDVSERIGNKDADFWVVKVDSLGVLEWEKVYGGTQEDFISSIEPVKGGGYIAIGRSSSDNGDVTQNLGSWDSWVIKLDDTGRIEWDRSFGNYDQDEGVSVKQTSDSGYILISTVNTYNTNPHVGHDMNDVFVTKLDKSGNVKWGKFYGGSGYEGARSIMQTQDGGYIFGAQSSSSDGDVSANKGDSDYWIVKLNDTGRIEWERSLGGSGGEWLNGIAQAADGGFVLAGWSRSADGDVVRKVPLVTMWDEDIWIVKIDKTGQNIVWNKAFGGSGQDEAMDIKATSDGGFIVTGFSSSMDLDVPGNYDNGNSPDGYLFKIDADGNSEWHKNIGGTGQDILYSVYPLADGGYIAAGNSQSSDIDIPAGNISFDNLWAIRFEAPAMDSIVVTTQGNIAAAITTPAGTLQMAATIYPRVLPQDVTWTVVPGTGTASINTAGLLTAVTNGTVWAKAASLANPASTDSVEVVISGQGPEKVQSVNGTQASVSIYPNPAGNFVNIQVAGNHPQLTLSVLNINGAVVSRGNIAANTLNSPLRLSLNHLPAGLYMLRLNGNGFETENVIVKQ